MNRIFAAILVLSIFQTPLCLNAQTKKTGITKPAKKHVKKAVKKTGKKGKKGRKRQHVNLEGLEVEGLLDRPQTLYILKKSDTAFKDNFDEYDYMKAIIDPTYKEPF